MAAIFAFAQEVLAAPAEISEGDVDQLRTHGYRDEQIAEVAGLVVLQLLSGAFNLIADSRARPEALPQITAEPGSSGRSRSVVEGLLGTGRRCGRV